MHTLYPYLQILDFTSDSSQIRESCFHYSEKHHLLIPVLFLYFFGHFNHVKSNRYKDTRRRCKTKTAMGQAEVILAYGGNKSVFN